jgi:hypothetical protein
LWTTSLVNFAYFRFNLANANRRTVNERLPTELGWTTPATVIKLEELFNFSNDIINATTFDALEAKSSPEYKF